MAEKTNLMSLFGGGSPTPNNSGGGAGLLGMIIPHILPILMGNQGEAAAIHSKPFAVGQAFDKTGRIDWGVIGLQLLAPTIASSETTLRLSTTGDSVSIKPDDLKPIGEWFIAMDAEFREKYDEAAKTESEMDLVSKFAKLFGLV
jgi:hypothetical protein